MSAAFNYSEKYMRPASASMPYGSRLIKRQIKLRVQKINKYKNNNKTKRKEKSKTNISKAKPLICISICTADSVPLCVCMCGVCHVRQAVKPKAGSVKATDNSSA